MICNTCKLDKTEVNFPINRTRKLGRGEKCLECKSLYNAKHYKKNKKKYRDKNIRQRQKIKEIVDQLKDKPCADCKTKYPPHVMDFDHLRDKKFEIGDLRANGKIRQLKEEIEKCEIVCANCHRERTHSRMV